MNSPLSDFNPVNKFISGLYLIPMKVQFCHHLTSSYSAHKALDKAYDELNDLKDEIVEKIIGYSQKFTSVKLESLENYTEMMNLSVAGEIMKFGEILKIWASEKGYSDIENLAQTYSGVGAKLKYLLMLK